MGKIQTFGELTSHHFQSLVSRKMATDQNKGKTAANEKKYTQDDIIGAILFTLFILALVGLLYWAIFIDVPRFQQQKLDEENDRLLDREMLRSMYAHLQNEGKILESLIKKTYIQTMERDDDVLQMKPIAEKILKVIGEVKDY